MGTMNKLTKIVLSFLMVITCINFSTVQAEDGEEVNYSEPTTVETVSEDPANEVEQEVAQEEPAVEEEATVEEAPAEQPAEEATPVEEPQQEEVAPEASEEAQVEEVNNAPEEAASEETTVAAEPQQEETTAEVQYPAFNATIEEQGVTLSASEGVFPEGTTVSATDKSDDDTVVNALEATISAANGENLQATGFVAYDFSFVDASGNKVEPKGDVSVTYSNISTTIPSSEVYRVYHVTDEGNVEAVEDSKVTVSDGQVTFTANSFSSYAVVGYNTIQPAVNAEDTENSDANTSEDNIALAATGAEYNIYHYALIPGKSIDDTTKADDNWFGLGVTAVTGAKNPSNLEYGTQTNFTYTSSREVKKLFPDITYSGKTYQYAASGSGNEDKEGYYTLMPARVVVADGANAGNNSYNPTASGKTYHKDYTMVMNEKNIYTVTFNVQDPGETTFGVLNAYSQRVSAGTSSSRLKKPTSKDVPATKTDAAGNNYTFDGWYTNEECTQRANFNGTVQQNTNYYGKYVAETYTVNYDTNGGKETYDAQTLKYNDVVDTSSFTPTRKGYIFAGWYYGKTNASGQKYAALAKSEETKEITLKAKWNEKKISDYLTIEGQNYTGKYDGDSHEVAIPTVTPKGESERGNLTYEYSVDGKTWTTDNSKITAKDVSDSKDVKVRVTSDEYVGSLEVTEKLTVTPRQIELTSADAEKVYNGEALTNGTVTVSGDGFAKDEGATYNVTGTITDVGSTDNTFTYELKDGAKAGNYKITPAYGTLKVTPVTDKVTVTIKENSGTKKYDGTEKSVTGYTVKSISNTLYTANDFTFSGTAEAKGTDAGSYDMDVKASDFTNTSRNFTNVEFVIEDGTLTIEKRNVTLTSKGDSKVYDGTPLTNDKVEVTGDGFVKGEGATYNVTGTITNVGSTDNTFTYELKDGTKAGNYEITPAYGKLEVTANNQQVIVKITGHSGTEKYDGTEKNVSDYDVSITKGSTYTANDFTFSGTAEAKGTDAGTYKMGLTAEMFANANDNFTDVTFEVTDGTLTIEKRNVTLTSADAEKVYNGEALTNGTVTVSGDGFAKDEGATYNVTGTITDVGSTDNTFTYELKDGAKAGNYEITPAYGTLKVTPVTDKVTVTIKENSGTKKYDGTEKSVTGYTVKSISNTLYTANDFAFSGTAEAKGTDAGSYDMDVKASDFTNTSRNFTNVEFVIEDGTLTIEKRNVTLTSADAEKVYNGEALTNGTVTVSGDGFAKDEGATYNVTGTITDVGSTDNTFTYELKDGAKAGNYKITPAYGTLKVTPVTDKVTVTIKENSGTKKYDGTEKSVTGYTVKSISNTLYTANDFTFSGTAEAKGTDAGSYDMDVKASDFTNTSRNFTNVEFVIEDGTLTIEKRNVTLTSEGGTKVYDGKPLTKPNVKVSGDGFVKGEVTNIVASGRVTNVSEGTVSNAIGYSTGETFKNGNYNIVTEIGKIKITPVTDKVTVKIAGNSATEEYDGTEKKVTGYKVTNISNKLYTNDDFNSNIAAEAKGTNAGTYDMGLLPGNFKNNSENFTDVTFEVTDGHLTITPKSIVPDRPNTEKTGIEVTKPDDSKYDGKLHQNKPTVTDTKTKATLVEGTDYVLSYTSAINAGTVTVTITGKGNYEGSTETTYEITKRNVTLTSATDSKIYDKTALTNDTVTVSGDKFAEGEGATYNFTGSQTNVGKSDNEFTYTLDKDTKAGNYNIKVKYGELTVTTQDGEVIVVITGHKDEFEYDGTEKSVCGYDVSITKGSTYTTDDFTFSGNSEVKGTDANTYPMGLTAENFTNNNENYTKVRFIVNDGEMTITPKSIIPDEPDAPEVKTGITVTKPSDTMYNGGEQKNNPTVSDSKTDATLEEGKDYELSYSADVTNVGKVTVTITGKGNYEGSTETTYEITKRNVKLTSASDSKIYDGTPLTRPDVTVEGDGFVEGEVTDIKAIGNVTTVAEGEVKNEITYTTGTNFKNTNYTIEKIEGKLTIVNQSIDPGEDPENPNPYYVGITINAPENQLYDGKKHLWIPEVLDKDGKPLTIGTDYTIAYTDVEGNLKTDFTNVTGMIYVTISGTGNYTGTVTRTYEITKRDVVLTSATDSKKFDGTPLRNENVEVTGEGFAEGEGATYSEFAEVTNVTDEAVANTFTYTLNENTLASNYNISTELGTLTITPKSIIPDGPVTPEEEKTGITVENPGDVKYDGKDHAEKPIVKDEKTGVTLEEGKDYEIVYPEDIKNAGEITANVVGKGDYEGSFEIKYNITKRDVTFTSATDSKQYDGNALTNGNVEITGDGFIEGEGATFNVTGSITDVGSTNNAFTYAMNEGTNADNYNVTVVEGTLTVSEQPVVPTPATPTTPSNNTPARTNNVPARVVTNPTTTTPAPEATVEPEKAETTPAPTAEPEKIKEEVTPQVAPKGHWALINLIAAMLSVVLAVVALLAKHAKDEDDEDKDDQVVANENEDDENESTRHRRWKVIATIDAILAVVVFILTENISLQMVLVDKWTLLMVLFGLISIVSTYFARKWHEEDEDEDEESSQNA